MAKFPTEMSLPVGVDPESLERIKAWASAVADSARVIADEYLVLKQLTENPPTMELVIGPAEYGA